MKKQFDIRELLSKREMGALVPLLILLVVIALVNNKFFRVANLMDVLRTTSFTFVLAAPLTALMITGNRDLSVGATTALGGVVCAWGMTKLGWGVVPSILLGLFSGLVVGIIKSFICVKMALPTFMVTLGLQYMINGFLLITTLGNPITGFPKSFQALGQSRLFGFLFLTIVISVISGLIFHLLLKYSKFGRSIYATGGNRETARLAGIDTNKIIITAHLVVSIYAAFVGILYASRFNSAQYNAGAGSEMTIMASIIIGGTSFGGGVGTVLGSFIGCLLLACINNGLVLMHVSTFYQNLVFGGILIISLALDKIRNDRTSGGLK